MKQRAIAYTRVSSQRQVDEGNSLSVQKKHILEYAEKNGFEIIKFFVEQGESAKNTQRTQLQAMLRYMVENHSKIDALIIYKVDRLARNNVDYYEIKQILAKLKIRLYSVMEQFDDDTAGHAMEGMLSIFAQFDNENRAKVCKNGMIEAVRNGRYTRPAPRGYKNGRDANNKPNILLSDNTKLVQILAASWKLIDNGLSCADARKEVNKMLKEINEKPITKQTFSNMIHNEIYIGIIHAFDLVVDSPTIPHLIDRDTFYRVQAILSKEKKRGNRYSKYNPAYPLRGILFCKHGHRMTASSPKGRNGHYPKYSCQKCRGKDAANYDVDTAHIRFDEFISNVGVDGDIKDALELALKLNIDKVENDTKAAIDKCNNELSKIQTRREILTEKLINGAIPDTSARKMFDKYDKDELEAKSELLTLKSQNSDAAELLEFGLDKLVDLKQTLNDIKEPEIRFRFQKWLFPVGLTYDGEKFGTAKMPLIFRLKKNTLAGILTQKSSLVAPTGLEPVTQGSSGLCSTN